MKTGIIIFCFGITFFNSCKNIQTPSNDVACLRKINTIVSKELEKEFPKNFDSIQKEVKLFMNFYIQEKGYVDSIVFVKSNLKTLGVNEEKIVRNLEKYHFECLWNVYYEQKLKPDFVSVVFNPKLIE